MAKKLRQGKLRAAAKKKVKGKAQSARASSKAKLEASRREWAETRSKSKTGEDA